MKRSIRAEVLFLDTWGWLVLADSREPAHSQAVSERRSRGAPGSLVTTDYVLDETFTRLFARCSFAVAREFSKAIMEAASGSGGLLRIERITLERFEAAYQMRLRYRDKPGISFTDLTSFVVMKDLGITDVLTADAHFAQARLGFRCLP
jgi:uncharacterized protein